MTDETGKQTQEELGLGITDDPSSSSAEGTNESEVREGEKGKETLTPEEQKDRVSFGRGVTKRLSQMEQSIADRFSKTEETLSRFEQLLSQRFTPPHEELTDIEESEYQRHKKFRERENREQIVYEQDFRKSLDQIKEKDPALHKEIFDEMFANFNTKASGNPRIDAELNYTKAKASLMAKKLSVREKNKDTGGSRNLGPTGLNIGSRTGEAGEQDVALPPDAENYIKSRGKDAAFIKRALSDKA